jgi:hypothetical protein
MNKSISVAIALSTVLVLVRLVIWGGIPAVGPLFWVGVALLMSTMAIFAGLCWWLFFSPLPAGRVKRSVQLPASSYLMLLAALVAGLLSAMAVFWDETWHRIYGFGAVLNDFLWGPHKILYVSLGTLALIAGLSLYRAIRADRSDVRAGFRTFPHIGMLGLAAAYLIASLPSDQVWHLVFGLDITAWSLPHIILLLSFGFAMISLAAVFLVSSAPSRTFNLNHVLGGLALGIGGVLMLVLVTEYDSVAPPTSSGNFNQTLQIIAERPQWAYPVTLLAIGILLATVGVRLSRRFGVVTIAALFIGVFRTVAVTFFNASGQMGVVSHWLVCVPMIGIDLWQLARKDKLNSLRFQSVGAVLSALVFMSVAIPVINAWLATYKIGAEAIPGAVIFGVIMAAWASLLGNLLGGWLASLESGRLPEVAGSRVAGQAVVVVALAAALFLFFFFTATPPTV